MPNRIPAPPAGCGKVTLSPKSTAAAAEETTLKNIMLPYISINANNPGTLQKGCVPVLFYNNLAPIIS
jgi:hypothetical protein